MRRTGQPSEDLWGLHWVMHNHQQAKGAADMREPQRLPGKRLTPKRLGLAAIVFVVLLIVYFVMMGHHG